MTFFFSPSNTNPFWWPLLSHARKNFFRNQLLIVVLIIYKDFKKNKIKKSKLNQCVHIRIHSFITVSRLFFLSYISVNWAASYVLVVFWCPFRSLKDWKPFQSCSSLIKQETFSGLCCWVMILEIKWKLKLIMSLKCCLFIWYKV